MMKRFCDECWRIVKFLLMTFAVNIPLSLLYAKLISVSLATVHTGMWLSLASCAYNLLSAAVAALVNRYFTFHATEKWYVAVPTMMAASFLWSCLSNITAMMIPQMSLAAGVNVGAAYLENVLWLAVSYLLQRCVIYRHNLDTNAWYHRFHLAYEEASDEGGTPDEEA